MLGGVIAGVPIGRAHGNACTQRFAGRVGQGQRVRRARLDRVGRARDLNRLASQTGSTVRRKRGHRIIGHRGGDRIALHRHNCAGAIGRNETASRIGHAWQTTHDQLAGGFGTGLQVHGTATTNIRAADSLVAGAAVGRHLREVEAGGIVVVDRDAATTAGSGTPLSTVAYATIGPDLAGATEDSDMQVDATSAARAVCSRAVGQHQPIQSQRSRSQFDQATAVAAIVVAVVVFAATAGAQLHWIAVVTIHPANIAGAVMRVRLGPHASVASAGIATGPRNIAIGSSKVCATV